MRILMDYRPALRQRTGAGEYVHRLAQALQARLASADRLTLFSSSWKDRMPDDVVPGARQKDLRVPVSILNLAWHRLEWPPAEWLAGDADIAHSMHPLLMPARRAAQFVTLHDLYFLDHAAQTSAEIRRDYAALAAGHARRAAGVIVPSEHTRQMIVERLGVPESRVTVCSPGAPDWQPGPAPPASGPILFIGTIEPRKNVPGLLQAYAALVRRWPEAPPLVLAGRAGAGVGDLTSVAGMNLASRVRLLGYVSDARRETLYREASLLAMPSLDEGFGLPVLEAMTLGVPVVAARRGSLPEVLGGAGLLAEPQDPDDLAAAMRRALQDESERARMTAAGIARAGAYSWATAADRLYGAYASALADRRRA